MKRQVVFLSLFLICFIGLSQEGESPLPYVSKEPVFDTAPKFPGGTRALEQYFVDSIRYSAEELEKGKQGEVIMKFTVDKKGKLKQMKAINGIPGAPNFVKESVRLLETMPLWKPATKNGKPVETEYVLCIPFKPKATRPHSSKKTKK